MSELTTQVNLDTGDSWVESTLLNHFQKRFDQLKEEFAKNSSVIATVERLVKERLKSVEEEFIQAWNSGKLQAFLTHLDNHYSNLDLSQSLVTGHKDSVLPQLELFSQKRFNSHRNCIVSAAEELQKACSKLEEQFADFVRHPQLAPFPELPELKPVRVDESEIEDGILATLTTCLKGTYERMAEIAKEELNMASVKISDAEMRIRKRSVSLFKGKLNGKAAESGAGGEECDDPATSSEAELGPLPRHPSWSLQLGVENPIFVKVFSENCNVVKEV